MSSTSSRIATSSGNLANSSSINTKTEIINPPQSQITDLMNQLQLINKQRQAFAVGDSQVLPPNPTGGGRKKTYKIKQITGYGKKKNMTLKANNLEEATKKAFSRMRGGCAVFQVNDELFSGKRTKKGSHTINEIKQI